MAEWLQLEAAVRPHSPQPPRFAGGGSRPNHSSTPLDSETEPRQSCPEGSPRCRRGRTGEGQPPT
eukprot:5812897-Alexandrium_andersonii.AAC.1